MTWNGIEYSFSPRYMYVCMYVLFFGLPFLRWNTIQAHHLTQFGTRIFSSPGDSVMVLYLSSIEQDGVGFGHSDLLNPAQ